MTDDRLKQAKQRNAVISKRLSKATTERDKLKKELDKLKQKYMHMETELAFYKGEYNK